MAASIEPPVKKGLAENKEGRDEQIKQTQTYDTKDDDDDDDDDHDDDDDDDDDECSHDEDPIY